MKTMLEAKGISKIYNTGGNAFEALKDIHLQVKEGEFVGIMGTIWFWENDAFECSFYY